MAKPNHWSLKVNILIVAKIFRPPARTYEGWNFNFGNAPLDWIQAWLE